MVKNRLKEVRMKNGMTAAKVGEVLGVGYKYIYELEKGRRRLHDEAIVKLCNLFQVSSDYLLCMSNTPTPVDTVMEENQLCRSIDNLPKHAKELSLEIQELIAKKYGAKKSKNNTDINSETTSSKTASIDE